MLLKVAARSVLILLPLTTSAARLHAHTVETPIEITQQLNRCLMIVRTAASRRGAQQKGEPKIAPARACQSDSRLAA